MTKPKQMEENGNKCCSLGFVIKNVAKWTFSLDFQQRPKTILKTFKVCKRKIKKSA